MKIKALALFLMLLLLMGTFSGCVEIRIGGDNLPKYTETVASTGEAPQPATETPQTTQPAQLPVDQLVTEADFVELAGTDTLNNTEFCYQYAVPKINLSSDDAAECNREIAEECNARINEARRSYEQDTTISETGISYEASVCDGILSIVVDYRNDWGHTEYDVFVFDTTTGEELDNDELFALYSYDDCDSFIRDAATTYFEEMVRDIPQDDFYREQYDKTRDEDNLDDATLYFDTDGNLMLCANIYSLVGADSYWYLIATTGVQPTFNSCTAVYSRASID